MWRVTGRLRQRNNSFSACDPELFDVTHLPAAVLAAIEADSFWCLSKLLDGIQDNYITAQPGIHRLVRRMAELVRRIDRKLRQSQFCCPRLIESSFSPIGNAL